MNALLLGVLAACAMQFTVLDQAKAEDVNTAAAVDQERVPGVDEIAPNASFQQVYVCVARDYHGRSFRAKSRSHRNAEWRALDACYYYGGHRCYIAGCQKRWEIDL